MLKPNQIEAVFFDAAGTLFEVRGGVGEVYASHAARFGVLLEIDKVRDGFRRHFHAQPPMAFQSGLPEGELKSLEYEWWRRLLREVLAGIDFPRFEDFLSEVFDYFSKRDAWRLFDDVVPALDYLQSRGVRLGVISNFDSRLFGLLKQFELDRYFESVHISTREGAAKPDPAIFRAALNRFQIEPRQAIHLGDGLREDYEGARAVGMNAFLLDRSIA